MFATQAWLLIGAVFAVGVLHTLVPDHWVPIAVIARQQRWSSGETARAAMGAGAGHTISTLLIGLLIWIAGVAVAARFGHYVSLASSFALIAFGSWISLTALRDTLKRTHERRHDRTPGERSSSRMALMLILGSSPMVEGIPAFFAAARFGIAIIGVMSIIFAVSTIATYVALCVYSTKALTRITFGPLERYGEVLSGAIVAVVGIVFLVWPVRS
jgi:hypothetical protein